MLDLNDYELANNQGGTCTDFSPAPASRFCELLAAGGWLNEDSCAECVDYMMIATRSWREPAQRDLALRPCDTPVALAAINMIRNVQTSCSEGLPAVLAISFDRAYGISN